MTTVEALTLIFKTVFIDEIVFIDDSYLSKKTTLFFLCAIFNSHALITADQQ